jgi:hypothetical protein
MNQRIKELVEQAYEMKPYMVADPETFEIVQKIGYDGQPMFHRDFNREKFAELIVKECIEQAELEEDRFTGLDAMDLAYAMQNFQNLLKQHFGIDK